MHKSASACRNRIGILILGSIPFILIAWILFAQKTPIGLDDGLRHITAAQVIIQTKLWTSFDWGQFFFHGYLAHMRFDPWFLADICYVPFAAFSTVTGLKLFTLCSIAALMAAYWYALRRDHLTYAQWFLLWAILLFGDAHFLIRLLLGRPYVLVTALTIVLFTTMKEKKWVAAGFLMGLATLFSHLFILPLAIGLFTACWFWTLRERSNTYKGIAALFAGTAIGLLVHPQSAEYLQYMMTVFFRIPLAKNLQVGRELFSGIGIESALYALLGYAVLHCTAMIFLQKKEKLAQFHRSGLTLLAGICICSLLAFLVWRRAIDVAWPFAMLLIGSLWSIAPLFHRKDLNRKQSKLVTVIVSLIIAWCLLNILMVTQGLSQGSAHRDLAQYENIAIIPAGSNVLNIEWDIFPILFNLRQDLRYAVGLDPTFTNIASEVAYGLTTVIQHEALLASPRLFNTHNWIEEMQKNFPDAEYLVLSSARFQQFFVQLREEPSLEEMSGEDASLAIYKILTPT